MSDSATPASRPTELRLEGVIQPVNGVAFAVDIGGSLAKLAYYAVHKRRTLSVKGDEHRPSSLHAGSGVKPANAGDQNGGSSAGLENGDDASTSGTAEDQKPDPTSAARANSLPCPPSSSYTVLEEEVEVGRLHLCYFKTTELEECVRFIEDKMDSGDPCVVRATGGGAHKYPALFASNNMDVHKLDEMECLVRGSNYLLKSVPDEAFTFNKDTTPQRQFFRPSSDIFPYLLVNIGSGVSIIKVESDTAFERVDGSALGGGTFWGLGSLLTGAGGFDEILDLAQRGDCRNADMLVRDIYGETTPQSLGLDPDLTASCFGKARKAQDAAASLLQMVAFNIAQISCLNARLHNIRHIFFAGFFIQNQPTTMHMITQAVAYWGRGDISALFLRHEGYVGAVGSFLGGVPTPSEEDDETPAPTLPEAVQEQYSIPSFRFGPLQETFNFEIEQHDPFVRFPLLPDLAQYKPDTIDLMLDEHARDYWLACFKGNIDREYQRALDCETEAEKQLRQRADAFRTTFLTHMNILSTDPSVYGELSVRIILELRQQCLREFGFGDIYSAVKCMENEAALAVLPRLLGELNALPAEEELLAVIEGALAGNCFDWGAEAVARQLDAGTIDFLDQRAKIREKRWLHDDTQAFVAATMAGKYDHVVMFVDNAGADVVLGMLPLTRALLKMKCRVTLAANSKPVLNDITFPELSALVQGVAKLDPVFSDAIAAGALRVLPNGTGSPCIDLNRVGLTLAQHVHDADLVILEGMGRAIHTNYDASMTCDTLKLAMIKNAWLANKLGGEIYDVLSIRLQQLEQQMRGSRTQPQAGGFMASAPPRRGGRRGFSNNSNNHGRQGRNNGGGNGNGNGKGRRFRGNCHYCGKYGHRAAECRKKQRDNGATGFTAQAQHQHGQDAATFVATTATPTQLHDPLTWLADTGASHHLTFVKDAFVELSPHLQQHHPRHITAFGGTRVPVRGVGSVLLHARTTSGATMQIVLQECLYVPEGQANLIALGRLTRDSSGRPTGHSQRDGADGHYVRFSHGAEVKLKERSSLRCWPIVAVGPSTAHGLTADGCKQPQQPAAAPAAQSKVQTPSMHEVLGHRNDNDVQQYCKLMGIDDRNAISSKQCTTCAVTKSTRHSVSKHAERTQVPGERIHADIVDWTADSPTGKRYSL
ncbi:pantothenate kinase 4 [Salpingoeca rosetta]|uniref:Pantothenate kinase 4 n=1 Tax=Salpingoeca rosetta (strain ATCC 50818 / BSB-021) TaxID=946362 RepID=F2U356_SALR5|nr:pantothenate kinase 4 [Salpingoeca rosetta]EGD82050.1 pantothenate kinase 4 [Salpingoeca rosetta]|eukprot:XP_004996233.1 pantothenate kinase 4 [Salpingoeca rosetta]